MSPHRPPTCRGAPAWSRSHHMDGRYLAGAAVSPARCDPAEGVAERTKGDGRAMPPPLSGPPISKADDRGVLAAILDWRPRLLRVLRSDPSRTRTVPVSVLACIASAARMISSTGGAT
eukprot:CAMPEP_0181244880 /NCGR_PEP_ID=MMETSP1096-20121128/43111_1 /TAXON_ID=156174 ORGANISM="Chrysochromulina ericina, Strain CCMP281" /NCGR_SAMPLE_ID=MMETSP1096 /ASSEMBLY_ACC=CAM_ASM_000453 /LENGTH=117 /DNA_ID=CAMNT_0023341489 /DNA_START=500 /DNA_END=850 /DNA_ORIENTATION=+